MKWKLVQELANVEDVRHGDDDDDDDDDDDRRCVWLSFVSRVFFDRDTDATASRSVEATSGVVTFWCSRCFWCWLRATGYEGRKGDWTQRIRRDRIVFAIAR
jgi:hypothetical protein